MDKVPARFPECFADITPVICFQHVTNTAKISLYLPQGLEQKNNITIFLEPVIAPFQASEIAFFHEFPRAVIHKQKNIFQKPFKYLDFPVRELCGKKTGYLDILFFIIPMNELNGVFSDEMNKTLPLFAVNIVQFNGCFLLLGLMNRKQYLQPLISLDFA